MINPLKGQVIANSQSHGYLKITGGEFRFAKYLIFVGVFLQMKK